MASPRARASLLLAAVLAANLLFALGVVPPRLLFGPEPVAQVDYALHFSRTVAADEFLSRFGRSWGYDPYFMAGYPMGTVFDVNTKLLQVVVSQLHRVGVPLPTGFNLFVFLSVLLPAPMIWMAARNFRASSWEAALSAAIALSLYVLDPEISKVWAYGVITSGMAMYSLPLALSFLYRFTEERRPGWYVAFVVSSIGISLLHPLSFLLFYVPLAIYLVFRAGRTDRALWGRASAHRGRQPRGQRILVRAGPRQSSLQDVLGLPLGRRPEGTPSRPPGSEGDRPSVPGRVPGVRGPGGLVARREAGGCADAALPDHLADGPRLRRR